MRYFSSKKIITTASVSVLILVILGFLLRNTVSRIVINQKLQRFESAYGFDVKYHNIGLVGVRTFRIDTLSIIPKNSDTIFHIHRADIKLGILNLFVLKINPLEIKLSNPIINLTGGKDSSNYYKLIHPTIDSTKTKQQTIESIASVNNKKQVALLSKAIRAFFGLSTARFIVSDFQFKYSHNPFFSSINIPYLETSNQGFETNINVEELGKSSKIKLFAITDKKNNRIVIRATRESSKAQIPLIYHKLGIKASFDSLMVDLTAKNITSTKIEVEGSSSVSGFDVNSKRISDSTVVLDNGSFAFKLQITPEKYELDSSSTFRINELISKIGVSYVPMNKSLSIKLNTGDFEAQGLIKSLPKGLFTNLQGIQLSGRIKYQLDLGLNLENPDSLRLKTSIVGDKVNVTKFGTTNFAALNDTFTHYVYADTGFVKRIFVGIDNHDYVSLDKISPYIINAVITSEDGGFYYHKGFDIEGIKYAIAQNIREKRFVRGGSTITMQLIKNLYLNRKKNIFRKAEEFLIVWIIEENKLVTKDRMLEIYLNIIEWGPGIYGIKNACKFYFDKEPDDITLNEAIYLSSIIPKPSKYQYCFDKSGSLRSFMSDYYSFISEKLYNRGIISDQEYFSVIPQVELKGQAKNALKDSSILLVDSLSMNELLNRIDLQDSTLLLH